MKKVYTAEQIWDVVFNIIKPFPEIVIMPDGEAMPVAPSIQDIIELKELLLAELDVAAGYAKADDYIFIKS